MSDTPNPPDDSADARNQRRLQLTAALLSVLLHLLFVLVLLYSAKQVVTPPQGAAGGGRVRVNFIGAPAAQAPSSPAPSPPPSGRPLPPSEREAQKPVPPRKPVPQAEYIERIAEAQPEQSPRQGETSPQDARSPAASPPPAQRRPHEWTGRPPGTLEQDTAPVDRGRSEGPAEDTGRHYDRQSAQPSVEVGGFQIYYDLLAEERLRNWKAQGMKEISFPLPGMRSRMVCPVEIALRRGSGKCRLLDPNEPEMQAIGDAREVVMVMAVYRRGELVWRGPGAYR